MLCSVYVTDKLVSKVCAAGSRQHPTAHHASDAGRGVWPTAQEPMVAAADCGHSPTAHQGHIWGHDQQVRSIWLLKDVWGHDEWVRSVWLKCCVWDMINKWDQYDSWGLCLGTWPAGEISMTLEDCVWGHDQQVRSVWLLRTVFGDMTKGCLCASAVIISMLVFDTAGSVLIWNGRKPREPVQNQQTRKLINTSKLSRKHNSGGIYVPCI